MTILYCYILFNSLFSSSSRSRHRRHHRRTTGSRPLRAPLRPLRAPLRPLRAPLRPIRAPLRPLRAPLRPLRVPFRAPITVAEKRIGWGACVFANIIYMLYTHTHTIICARSLYTLALSLPPSLPSPPPLSPLYIST